jgi:tetratricopeptide (TPR) repeat protein
MKVLCYSLVLLILGMIASGHGFKTVPPPDKQAYRLHYQGSLLYAEGKYRQAGSNFERAYRLFPENFSFALAHGLCLGRLGDPATAKTVLEKARRMVSPTDQERQQKLALATFFLGMSFSYADRYGEALPFLRDAIAMQDKMPQKSLLSVFYNALGKAILLNQGRNSHRSNYQSLHYHVHRRDMEKAFLAFEAAVKADPENTTALYNYRLLADTLQVGSILPEADSTQARRKEYKPTFINMHKTIISDLKLNKYDELVFLVDISGSMVMEQVVCYGADRFTAMKDLCLKILPEIDTSVALGIGTIGGVCDSPPDLWFQAGGINRVDLRSKLRFLIPDGTTPLLTMLLRCPELFTDNPQHSKSIFLISDGANTCREGGIDICEWASTLAKKGIAVNVLTFLSTTSDNTDAFAEYLCLAENTKANIIYLDNYRCRLEPFAFDIVKTCQSKIPPMEKSNCLGGSVKGLWNVVVAE